MVVSDFAGDSDPDDSYSEGYTKDRSGPYQLGRARHLPVRAVTWIFLLAAKLGFPITYGTPTACHRVPGFLLCCLARP